MRIQKAAEAKKLLLAEQARIAEEEAKFKAEEVFNTQNEEKKALAVEAAKAAAIA